MTPDRTDERPIAVTITVTLTALVHAEGEAGGYSAEVPALPGCYTQGETLDEVRANLQDAAEGWLSVVHDAAVRDSHAQADIREGAA